jgi:tetratricopeptide (TPR) repeat protein
MTKQFRLWMSLGVLLLGWMGCNPRPDTPSTTWYEGSIESLAVDPADTAETRHVTAVEAARRRYRAALEQLEAYYASQGMVQKRDWARTEWKNLDEAQEFRWDNLGTVPEPVRLPDSADERTLVEAVLAARLQYRTAVGQLAQYYEGVDAFKAHVIHTMQSRFRPEETYTYVVSAAIPPETLRPSEIIPEADELFSQAEQLYYQGSQVPAMADFDKQREALHLFQRLIELYPTSTKISLSAYYIAEIYKEYFHENFLAVLWYGRARTWDPYVSKPVRFQEAVQYDFNLGEKNKALGLYQASLEYEPYYPSHVRYARQRIEELREMGYTGE